VRAVWHTVALLASAVDRNETALMSEARWSLTQLLAV
jgi:hypothetical protein